MPRHYPLTCAEVKRILELSGFELTPPRTGTSHEQWKKVVEGKLYKVTVDCPKAPFSQDLIQSMAKQAGMTKKQFYAVIDGQFSR